MLFDVNVMVLSLNVVGLVGSPRLDNEDSLKWLLDGCLFSVCGVRARVSLWLGPLRHGGQESLQLLSAAGQLALGGVDVHPQHFRNFFVGIPIDEVQLHHRSVSPRQGCHRRLDFRHREVGFLGCS